VEVREYYESYWDTSGFSPSSGVHWTFPRLVESHVSGRCLDFGCGDGSKSAWLASLASDYVGVDVAQRAVDSVESLGLRAERVDAGAPLPFESDSFDVAVAFDVLEHVFSPQESTAELARVLRPGGELLVGVPNAAYWRRRLDLLVGRWNPTGDDLAVQAPWRDPHIRFFTVAALARMLSGCDFAAVRVQGYGGALIREVPGLRRFSGRPSKLYRRLETVLPSLLGQTLLGVAVK
jgi:SAM-dependent methyltransferase